jgi:hypothetical protein
MKKQLASILLIVSLSALIARGPFMSKSLSLHTSILDTEHKPTLLLQNILGLVDIHHDGTLSNIVAITQKQQPIGFMRPSGKERWEISDIHEDKRSALLDLFRQMGVLHTLMPTKTQYDYAVVHGATLGRTRDRMLFLIELYQQGTRFDHVVVLSGKRILTDEEKKKLNNTVENEYEMVQVVWNQLSKPQGLDKLPILFVDSPMHEKNGVMMRPTTADTIGTWLKLNPKPGSIIAISNQPFCGYQDSVIRSYLPNTFQIETVGPAAQEDEVKISVLLDNLARWLYQEQIRRTITQ